MSSLRRHLGWVTLLAAACLAAPTAVLAATPTATQAPVTGNWEGTGPHGLPLSFALSSRHGKIIATNVALGFPISCPAQSRDADTVPLSGLTYRGPGATAADPLDPETIVIVGRNGRTNYKLSGILSSSRAGAFSTLTNEHIGCGWPTHNLSWSVKPVRRRSVADGVWRGTMSGGGAHGGTVRVTVTGGGRVSTSFAGSLTCAGGEEQGFSSNGSNEFISANGVFRSVLPGQELNGVRIGYSGTFDGHGHLNGTATVPSPCTGRAARVSFRATHSR
jgi:hypothetical protein